MNRLAGHVRMAFLLLENTKNGGLSLDWLPGPLSQEWLFAELKTVIEAQDLTFHSERTIDVRFASLPTRYLPDSAKAP